MNFQKIDIVLFSSSLQYLENPYFVLSKFIQKRIPDIIIHRSPFTDGVDVIKIQTVYLSERSIVVRTQLSGDLKLKMK